MYYYVLIPFLLVVSLDAHSFKVEKCKEELELGRNVLRSMAKQFVQQEHMRQKNRMQQLRSTKPSKYYRPTRFAATNVTVCPQPNVTSLSPIPTTPKPTTKPVPTPSRARTTTTAKPTTTSTTTTTTTTAAAIRATETDTASPSLDTEGAAPASDAVPGNVDAAPDDEEAELEHILDELDIPKLDTPKESGNELPEDNGELEIPQLFHGNSETDPYIMWMSKLHNHLSSDEAVCNGPQFRGINTVTNDQLWGFFSLFLTNHASSICSLCDGVFAKIEEKIFEPNPVLYTEEERYMIKNVFAYLPQTTGICSMMMPSCHQNYKMKVANITETTKCLKCPLCMTGLSLVQHRFLLDPEMTKKTFDWLQGNIFHNLCAELCTACLPVEGQNSTCQYFPDGVDYNQCMNFTRDLYDFIVDATTNVLKPEYFCSVELEWCQVNESPNIMNCLRQVCEEGLPVHIAATVCELIPSDPLLAGKFLNSPNQHTEL